MELLLLRVVERVIAVIIGGLSIYLGYRLFRAVKATGEGAVEVRLPRDVTVMVSRVAPGVFFALFGAVVVGGSLVSPVHYNESESHPSGGQSSKTREFTGIAEEPSDRAVTPILSSKPVPNQEALALERLQVRQHIAFLNQLPGLLKPTLPEQQQRRVRENTLATKLYLMHGVWDKDWGRFEDFELWAEGGAKAGDSQAFHRATEFFTYGQEEPR
jgi:hypothetical protein